MVTEKRPEDLVHYHPASSDNTACGVPIGPNIETSQELSEITCEDCQPHVPVDNAGAEVEAETEDEEVDEEEDK